MLVTVTLVRMHEIQPPAAGRIIYMISTGLNFATATTFQFFPLARALGPGPESVRLAHNDCALTPPNFVGAGGGRHD